MIKKAHTPYAFLLLATVLLFGAYALTVNAQQSFTFTASPAWIAVGESSNLTWNAPDQSCTSADFDTGGIDTGTVTVWPAATRTYSVRCSGVTKSVTVTVTEAGPPPPTTASISVNPTSIVRGNSAALTWSSNGTSCTGTNFSTGNAPSGTVSVTPLNSTTYTVSCTGAGGNKGASVTLLVTEPQFDASCTVNPRSARVGQTVTWTASAWNGTPPYSFEWFGEALDGLRGSSVSVSYALPGEKNASVDVTDSSTIGAGLSVNTTDGQRCTGPALTGNLLEGLAEDGGAQNDMERVAARYARMALRQDSGGVFSEPVPADVYVNPQNYCSEVKLMQRCDPNKYAFGAGACHFSFDLKIHQGNASRATTGSDFGDNIYDGGGDFGLPGYWDRTRYYGVAKGVISPGVPREISRSCNATVSVGVNDPTATLSANPISVERGNSSILTWSSTNASACVGAGFSTGGATSGSLSVSPTATTEYSVTCSSATGNAGGGGFVMEEWHTGGTQQIVFNEAVQNNGNLGDTCPNLAPVWNERIRYTNEIGDAGLPIAYQTCWSVTNPTGTTAKPYETSWTNNGEIEETWYRRSTPDAGIGGGSATAFATVFVSAAPDLTAGSITPTTATAGTPVTLSATASNIGNTSSGSFPVLFQVQETSALFNSGYLAGLAPGSSAPGSASYTFPAAGTYQVRACSNFNTSWTAITTESNYDNNCGPWTPVTVTNPARTGTLSCSVSNQNPVYGSTVTYTVTPSNGATGPYVWNDQVGGNYGNGASVNRLIPGAGPYVMNVDGTNVINPASCPVVGGQCPNPSATISATPDRVREGDTTSISWSATGVDTSCTISGTDGYSNNVPGASCTIPSGGPVTRTITTQTVYTISCDGGDQKAQVVVNVIPAFEEF